MASPLSSENIAAMFAAVVLIRQQVLLLSPAPCPLGRTCPGRAELVAAAPFPRDCGLAASSLLHCILAHELVNDGSGAAVGATYSLRVEPSR